MAANQVMGAKAGGLVTLESGATNTVGSFPCSQLFSGLADGYKRQVIVLVSLINTAQDNYSELVYLIGQVGLSGGTYSLDSYQALIQSYKGTAGTMYSSLVLDIDGSSNLRVRCALGSFTPNTIQGFTLASTIGP